MRAGFTLVLLVGLCAPAFATSATFGSRVLSEGDNVGRVYDVAGKPDRIVTLENRYGGAVAERFEYYRDGSTISVTVQGGKVIKIEQTQ